MHTLAKGRLDNVSLGEAEAEVEVEATRAGVPGRVPGPGFTRP
ncbi:hypothetical protein ABZ806_20275 [Spirillospora sp. NPDC047418]